MRGEKTCRFQPFHLLVSYSTYRSLQSCALIKSLHLYRCCAYEYSLEMNVLLLRRRACPALAKSWQRRREHVSVILGSNVLDFDKLRAVELRTASNKTSTCYARYIEERCSKDALLRKFYKTIFPSLLTFSRMLAISPITSLTSDYIALVVREPTRISQIHAPTYPTARTPLRDWDINLLEVILDVRAGDPAGWVPALRAL